MILEPPGAEVRLPGRRLTMGLFHFSNNNLATVAFQLAAFAGGLRRGMVLIPASILPLRGSVERG